MKNLIIGQRYMSIAEPELGLGIIAKIEDKTVVVSYPGSEESRRYGQKTAPLKRIVFEVGDEVVSNIKQKFIVSKIVTDEDGLLVYFGETLDDAFNECDLLDSINFHQPEEKLLNLSTDSQELFNLRYETIRLQTWLASHPYHGLMGARISLIHHQLYLVNEITKRLHPRVLLADEVGLGKTIEAGLIIHKLLITKRIQKVLIVLPNALCFQWFLELYRKYNLSFSVITEIDTLNPLQNSFDENNLVITSTQLISQSKDIRNNILNANFDLLVVDEAHRMAYKDGVPSETYKNIQLLGENIKSLLLLTATPEMFGLEGHFARLKLIDPEHFFDYQKFISDHDTLKEMATIGRKLTRGEALNSQDQSLLKKLHINKESSSEILEDLIDRHGTGRVYFRNTRKVMSKIYNFFPERFLHNIALEDTSKDKITYVDIEIEELGKSVSYNLKIEWLIAFLKENNERKVLLICRSRSKILKIEKDLLRMSVGNKIALFHSELSLLARDRQAAYFSDPDGANILLCSEIGSEGRNFEFANQLVLFDLPSTPDLLEQRIGRLDRIGQKRDIHIHVPYLKNSWEEILFLFYHQSLNSFEKTMTGGMKLMTQYKSELEENFQNVSISFANNREKLNHLLEKCSHSYKNIVSELEDGRDVLIELNSFRHKKAQMIVDTINDIDESPELQTYLDNVFMNFGVDIEDLGDQCHFIKPGDNMYIPSFPHLPADGFSYTCSRQKALEKENITFMTWDHPLVQGIMELIVGDEFGNATVVTRKKSGKPRPYLEIFFLLATVAPKELEIERFLPPRSLRVLINLEAENFTDKFSKEKLDDILVNASSEVRIAVTKIGKSRLKELFKKAFDIAQPQSKELMNKASTQVKEKLSFEIERLQHLQQVSSIDSSKDITLLQDRENDLINYIAQAEIKLDSFRFIY